MPLPPCRGTTTVPFGCTRGWPPRTREPGADEAGHEVSPVGERKRCRTPPLDGPAGVAYSVVPGRNPWIHVAPLSVEVAHPRFDEPPLLNRPDWNVATMVEPNE